MHRADAHRAGLEDRLLNMLTGAATQPDAVVFVGERILTLNRKPVAVRGATVGSVTTMRDLTELRQLKQELGVTRQTVAGNLVDKASTQWGRSATGRSR